jgi:hypothetical protein
VCPPRVMRDREADEIDVTTQDKHIDHGVSMIVRWLPVLFLISVAPSMMQRVGGDVVIRLHRDVDTKGPLPVFRSGKWGYIDHSGAVVISPQFEEAGFFYGGRAAVRLNGLWGYVDPAGSLVIPPRFSSAARFSDGVANVRRTAAGDGTRVVA